MTVVGKTTFSSDLILARKHTITSLSQDWIFLLDAFVILELTDTYVKFRYSTDTKLHGKWTAKVRFDFDQPGYIVKSDFIIDAGLLT